MSNLALLLALFAQGQQQAPLSDPVSPRTQAVMTAVFADMIRDVPGLAVAPYDEFVFCLEGPGAVDPPAAATRHLQAIDPDVRPQSACQTTGDPRSSFRATEKATRRPAIILKITSINCSDEGICLVECGYFARSQSASGNQFQVERRSGRWIVTQRRMTWIS